MSKASLQTEATDSIRIDRMTEHDLLEVVEIEETCGLSRWGWAAYHAELMNGHAGMMIVARLAFAAGEGTLEQHSLAGFVASRLVADEMHINNIAVRTPYRQRGLGGALLRTVLKEGKRAGALSCVLEVRASNAAAQALYLRKGFVIVGRRAGYYSTPPEDALVMRLTF